MSFVFLSLRTVFSSIVIPALVKQFDLVGVFFVKRFFNLILEPRRHKLIPPFLCAVIWLEVHLVTADS